VTDGPVTCGVALSSVATEMGSGCAVGSSMDIVVVELGFMVQLRVMLDIDLAVELVVNVEKNLRPLVLIVILRVSLPSGTRGTEVEGIRARVVGAADTAAAVRMAAIINALIFAFYKGDPRVSRCLR